MPFNPLLSCSGPVAFNKSGQGLWLFRGAEARHHVALPVDKELGKVPLDSSHAQDPQDSRPSPLEEAIQRMGMSAVHVDPGEDREAHAIIFFAKAPISAAVPGS